MEPLVLLYDNNLFMFLYKIVGTKSGTDCDAGGQEEVAIHYFWGIQQASDSVFDLPAAIS